MEYEPRITPVNGYQVVETLDGVFKVISHGRQVGEDFTTFPQAFRFIRSLPPVAS